MKKIPTVFERDWNGDRSRVINKVNPGCEWVLAGEGVATRKLDGTCCLVKDGRLYKRRELRVGEIVPVGFEVADYDEETGKTVGWLPVSDSPEDKWHRAAFVPSLPNGTYELLGPRVQGNPEHYDEHVLVPHSEAQRYENVPRSFDSLRLWLSEKIASDIEGLVFHHPDGRMAKIKLRDFGIRRAKGSN